MVLVVTGEVRGWGCGGCRCRCAGEVVAGAGGCDGGFSLPMSLAQAAVAHVVITAVAATLTLGVVKRI